MRVLFILAEHFREILNRPRPEEDVDIQSYIDVAEAKSEGL